MSVPKVARSYTYLERMKATFSAVQDAPTKLLCDDLLSFLRHCSKDFPTSIMDFTNKAMEEAIDTFLERDHQFVQRLVDKYVEFAGKGDDIDLFGGRDVQKNKNRLLSLIKTIDQHCYQVLCLCALYCPVEAQKGVVDKLFGYLRKAPSPPAANGAFRPVDHSLWTALLLLINPMKLKQQCDGSVEIFGHFREALQQQQRSTEMDHCCLKGTIQLALGVSIKYARNSLGLGIPSDFDDIELVETGIKNMALEFLHAYIVQTPSFSDHTLSIDVIDSLIKNFICYFRAKVVEMFNLCEEELYALMNAVEQLEEVPSSSHLAWQHQSTPPSPPPAKRAPNFENLHFKTLLELITALYEPDTAQLVQYSREFTDPNCEGLFDFIYRGRAISAPALKIAYLSMLTSLCKCSESADAFFNFFK